MGKPSPPAPPAREGRGGGHPEDVGLTREGQPDMNPQGQKGWREGKEASQIKKDAQSVPTIFQIRRGRTF